MQYSEHRGQNLAYLAPQSVHVDLSDVSAGGRLLMWGARTWVLGFQAGADVTWRIYNGFDLHHVAIALPMLDALMSNFAANARRPMDYRCLRCPELSPDELGLLNLCAACQSGKPQLAHAILADVLLPAAAPVSVRYALDLADAFVDAALLIRPQDVGRARCCADAGTEDTATVAPLTDIGR